MNIFERAKAAVTLPQLAAQYGLSVQRNGMICCPFHDDRHPSMKLNENYYYCFGCGATGDVIHFAARLFDLSNYEAAQRLAADFGVDSTESSPIISRDPKRTQIQQFREDEQLCLQALKDYVSLLDGWQVRYAPKSPEDPLDERFVEACQMLDYMEQLRDILTVGELEQRVRLVDELMKDGKAAMLQDYVKRKREEERTCAEIQ